MATVSANPTSDLSSPAPTGTWTGTAGSRFSSVNDYPDTGGTSVLTQSATAGGAILFGFTAFTLAPLSTVSQVQVLYYDEKTATQTDNVAAQLRVGSTSYSATSHGPANGVWTQRTDTWTTNPATSAAWTVADVNGTGSNPLAAFGWVSTDASPAVSLSSIQLLVTYTPPPDEILLDGSAQLILKGTAFQPTPTLTGSYDGTNINLSWS